MDNQKEKTSFGQWIKTSVTLRMIMIGVLILVLLIPLFYVQSLIRERARRQQKVVTEINQKWGKEILLYGPVLKIPYRDGTSKKIFNRYTNTYENQHNPVKNAYFFPDQLSFDTHVLSEKLGRSIYETVVYTSDIKIKGSFTIPDFSKIAADNVEILWEKATVLINSTNIKGIKNNVKIQVGTKDYAMQSRYQENAISHNLETNYLQEESIPKEKEVEFSINLEITGSDQLQFIPVGRETNVMMTSDWSTPSFNGNYLPNSKTKEISADGFKANWKVLQINREFEQEFFDQFPNLTASAFGVKLLIPVDEYQKSERATKYGYLVITLTFLIFFLIQSISKINIHPFQYLMIGLALVMFYTLLISISEHSSFLMAYSIASIAVISLISLYAKAILHSIKFMGFIAASLTVLYVFIYVIIQLENYALLVGSIGLFLILGTIMLISRKINWQNI